MNGVTLYQGDCREVLERLEAGSVHCCITSPPYYGLRDYGVAGQLGLEKSPEEYVGRLVEVFREVRRVLRDDGTLWLNMGDSYGNGSSGCSKGGQGFTSQRKGRANINEQYRSPGASKQLLGIPWRVAFALQADGWWLRSDIIWAKKNPMPESVRDRPTKAHEYLFLMAKSEKYYYDADAIREENSPAYRGAADRGRTFSTESKAREEKYAETVGAHMQARGDGGNFGIRMAGRNTYNGSGRNRRSVWTVATKPFKGAHFATFPPALVKPCVLAGCPEGGIVLDPFSGAATTGLVAARYGRRYIGIELNPKYHAIAQKRIALMYGPLFASLFEGGQETQTSEEKA
jgi:DNA modification methylase